MVCFAFHFRSTPEKTIFEYPGSIHSIPGREILSLPRILLSMAPIFNLPQDIFPANQDPGESIIFHYYAAPAGSFSGKSLLSQNAISLVMSGEKTMLFAEKNVQVNASEFHFLSSGNCLVSMKLNESIPFKSFLIFFDNEILRDFYLKHQKRIASIRGDQKVVPELYLAFKKDRFILNFIDSLSLLFHETAKISMEMKLLKFEELMLYLLENHPKKILSFQPSTRGELGDFEIKKAVESNITNSLSVEELAFLCNLSLSTFKRRFAKIFQTSPNKWILQKRMEMAKELLQHHGEKPGEIFHKIGYENHSSFTKSFKQAYGITPQDFQRKHLNVFR
jgi:AraC family transcriptional regulator, exoenzyme S synthesis regulatory protein ExsA